MKQERLHMLLNRYFDEALAPIEWSELEYLIPASGQATAAFWESARWHALLRQWAVNNSPDRLPDGGKESS